jgi:predicted ester cyclase
MAAEQNMALARRFMEERLSGDLDTVDQMLAPDFVNHNRLLPGQEPDRENFMQAVSAYQAALSECCLIIEDQVAGADKVVSRFIVHAIHDRGELMGVAPSGREMTNRAIVIHRIEGGKIAEEWGLGTLGSKLRGERPPPGFRRRRIVAKAGASRDRRQYRCLTPRAAGACGRRRGWREGGISSPPSARKAPRRRGHGRQEARER